MPVFGSSTLSPTLMPKRWNVPAETSRANWAGFTLEYTWTGSRGFASTGIVWTQTITPARDMNAMSMGGPAVEHVEGSHLFVVKDEQHARPVRHAVPAGEPEATALLVARQLHTPRMPADLHDRPAGFVGAPARRQQQERRCYDP